MIVSVRDACREDAGAIRSLEDAAFDHPWSAASIEATLRDPLSRVWVVAAPSASPAPGVVRAWAAFRSLGDEAELLRIATHPDQQRQGHARMLLETVWPTLRAASVIRVHLEVRADNHPALALYATFGFRPAGRRPGYYRDGTDALTLTRQLLP